MRRDLRLLSSSAGTQSLLWQWLAAAAALVLITLGVSRVNPDLRSHDYQTELAGEIVDMHRHSLQPGHTTGIASDNEQVVRQWFDDRLRFSLPVRNFADEGFALQGARVDNVEGRSVAALVYLSGGHLFNVFMWPTKEEDRSPHAGSLGGYQWIYWRKHTVEFCLVSDAAPGDLDRLHRLIAE
jgi:anti-sigma factor RsiW